MWQDMMIGLQNLIRLARRSDDLSFRSCAERFSIEEAREFVKHDIFLLFSSSLFRLKQKKKIKTIK